MKFINRRFLEGLKSQLDTYDIEGHGFEGTISNVLKSPWTIKPGGTIVFYLQLDILQCKHQFLTADVAILHLIHTLQNPLKPLSILVYTRLVYLDLAFLEQSSS